MSHTTTQEVPHFKRLNTLNKTPVTAHHPKYMIEDLLKVRYGNLGMEEAINDLFQHCRLNEDRTVKKWLKIKAGDEKAIHHIVLPLVLDFFEMQDEYQLFTDAHKQLLNHEKPQNHE